jgi:glucokinase
VLNDAHAALLGEVWRGAARGLRDVVLLTLGTGVGGAIYADGRLLRGAIGRAGHLGHLCLDVDGPPGITRIPGSLEDAVGECRLKERSGGRFATTEELMAAHRAGDRVAGEVWLRSMRKLACGVASIINAVDPEVVLLGGGISTAGEELLAPLRGELADIEWRPGGRAVELRLAELGAWAGACGAAWQGNGESH